MPNQAYMMEIYLLTASHTYHWYKYYNCKDDGNYKQKNKWCNERCIWKQIQYNNNITQMQCWLINSCACHPQW